MWKAAELSVSNIGSIDCLPEKRLNQYYWFYDSWNSSMHEQDIKQISRIKKNMSNFIKWRKW